MANYYDMSVNELRHLVSQNEAKITSKIKSISKKGLYSPAIKGYEQHKINKPTSKMSKGELINTVYRQNQFKQAETGTVKGTYSAINNARKSLAGKGVKISNKNVGKLFGIYDKMADKDPSIKGYKYDALKEISDKIRSGMSEEEILQNAEDMLDELYIDNEIDEYDDFEDIEL